GQGRLPGEPEQAEACEQEQQVEPEQAHGVPGARPGQRRRCPGRGRRRYGGGGGRRGGGRRRRCPGDRTGEDDRRRVDLRGGLVVLPVVRLGLLVHGGEHCVRARRGGRDGA